MMAIFRESMGRHTRRHTRQSVNELTHGWHYSATFLNWTKPRSILDHMSQAFMRI